MGNIHLSWDLVTERIRLGGLIYSFESFLQLNMCQELEIFAFVYMYLYLLLLVVVVVVVVVVATAVVDLQH